jgi:tetratricopeptide (TPR) repeat protein
MDRKVMDHQADIHLIKSEYREAHNIQTQILQEYPICLDSYTHGLVLLNLAEINLSMNAPQNAVQQYIERAKKIFLPMEQIVEITICDMVLAALHLREGAISTAKTLFKTCLRVCNLPALKSYCLERLGNTGRWGAPGQMFTWTMVYFAHSIKFKEKLGIYKALQFLGDIFLSQVDEDTAVSLYIVALEGFTYMDVHHSRAERMLRLGDNSMAHGDLLKAVEFWEAAKPLFERTSQAKQVEDIGERLASVGKDVVEQHKLSLACLTETNAPTALVEEVEDYLSDIEDLQEDLGGVQSLVTG